MVSDVDVRLERVTKRFGDAVAVDDLSVDVGAGEFFSLLGPSGCGKTTTLRMIGGFEDPTLGTIYLGGRDVTAMSDVDRSALRRSEFGFIFQFGQLVPELTCVENVALPLRLGGVRRREAERRAHSWLAQLEVDDVAQKLPGTVSGGQGQRVAVARALVQKPALVLADEPTGNLDRTNARAVGELLLDLHRQQGAILVVVTHSSELAMLFPARYEMADGTLHRTS